MRLIVRRHPPVLRGLLVGLFALAPWVCLAPGPARAAEITEVADAADGDDPFDLELELGWHRDLEQAKITRENLQTDPATGRDGIVDVTELRYKNVKSEMLITGRAGLYHDLEIHLTIPVVFADNQTWRSASIAGLPENSTIHNRDGLCPNGTVDPACAAPLFDFNGDTGENNSYRAGLGDIRVGLAWGILNDQRDKADPSWVIAFDWQAPTAAKRRQDQISHDSVSPADIGEKTNYFTFSTALSKNLGLIDPFIDFHYRLPSPQVPHAWHNCDNPSDSRRLPIPTTTRSAPPAPPMPSDESGCARATTGVATSPRTWVA